MAMTMTTDRKRRPTEAEFDELRRKRDESVASAAKSFAEEHGWDPAAVTYHASHTAGCYCACPDGPCQHTWDGPEWVSEDECASSRTCSRCGAVAMHHDMRCGP